MRRMISMDYGIEVPSYRRVDSEKEKKNSQRVGECRPSEWMLWTWAHACTPI